MNATTRLFTHSSQLTVAALVAAAALAGVDFVQASPDPPIYITNGVALFQGNQINGITNGVDFQLGQVTTLDVNSLSGPIQPANGMSGISFQNSGAGNVVINAGLSGSNIVINATGAAGINAGSVGSPPANPPPDPFWGIPIPTSSSAQGGVVQVQSVSDITTEGDNAAGIVATSQTTGYSPGIIQGLTNLSALGVTFTVVGVTNADGTAATVGGSVSGTLVDTNGTPIAGSGGTFAINTNGTFSFDAGTNFDGLTNGQTVQTIVNYTVQGVNGTGITNDSSGTLVTTITMTTNGLVFDSGAYLDAYGPSTNQNSVLPDLASYGQTLAGIASAGGAGNSVTVTNEGAIKTYGNNSSGIFAQSIGGNGGTGGGGSAGHSAGQGGTGSNGGAVTVTANGSITTISNYSVGVVAWSQGGTGGQGGDGGFWRYGGPGGTGGNGGDIYVNGSGTITTAGDYASGILAVSAGGDGGAGGSSDKVVTGGGNGGNGGQGGTVTVDGDWNITTTGDYAHGIWAKSVGGNAGSGGSGGWIAGHPGNGGQATDGGTVIVRSGGTIETSGDNSYGIYAESVGGFGGQGGGQAGIFYSHGGSGESAGNGGDVYVTQDAGGQIITYGTNAHGIFAESIGGGGGSGGGAGAIVGVGGTGGAGGNGGNVTVTNYGEIQTYGEYSKGIYAQSIGGGGGDGAGSGGLVGIGGSGSGVSYGGKVSVFNFGGILTSNDNSDAICAQSIGGGGGSGGGSGGLFSIGGSGTGGGSASNVDVVNSGRIFTYGTNSHGIFIESIGGGGGDGAGSGGVISIGGSGSSAGNGGIATLTNSGTITTLGEFSSAIEVQSIGGGGGDGAGSGGLISIGGGSKSGGNGASVIVANSGDITTFGDYARGIYLQSIGGGGGDGNGGNAFVLSAAANVIEDLPAVDIAVSVGGRGGKGGNGGAVAVQSSGTIITSNSLSAGILAQSVGGGGGNGGNSTTVSLTYNCDVTASAAVGGKGGVAGNGGTVGVTNNGGIRTEGNYSSGIFAQSVGGGGGQGGNSTTISGDLSILKDAKDISPSYSFTMSMGGNGGGGGTGGTVNVNSFNNIVTKGAFSYGIQAQSIGGSGGSGGNASTYQIELSNTPESLAPALSLLSFSSTFILGGNGGAGGNAGNVMVNNTSNVWTEGVFGVGILAQSVGGGGGFSGISDDLDLSSLLFSPGTQAQGDATENTGSGVSFAGSVGGNGSGGNVTVVQNGNIVTYGNNAHGIYAQSAGGQQSGGTVSVTVDGNIFAQGTNSDGIRAQSVGASGSGNISVNILSGTVQGGWGSSVGVRLLDGENNTLTNYGAITTLNGMDGTAILGTGGNESVNNYGVIIGSVDLGVGNNLFNNFSNSWFNAGGTINLGQGNLYRNAGVLCPGGNERIQTTALTGNFTQTADGTLGIKLAPVSDQLAISGTAVLDGSLVVSRFNDFVPVKGEQFTILTAGDGVTGQFASLFDPLKGNYALQLGTLYGPDQVNLITLQGSFVPFALTPNQVAVARNLDTFSGFLSTNQLQGDPRETNLIASLDAVPGPQLPADFDLIAPEELGSLFDMNFGAVDTIVGNVQRRMNDIRTGYTTAGNMSSLFVPGGPAVQLASADRSLPPMEKASRDDGWSAFAGGFGQFIDVNTTAATPGYSLQNSGVVLDFDKRVENCLAGGFTLDYAGGEASLVNGGSADMAGGRGGLYGSWFNPNAYLEAQLGGGGYHYSSQRAAVGGTASGDTDGYEVDTMLGGGYDLKFDDFTAGMLAEMHYTYVDINGFTETGSASPLQVMNNDSDSLWTLVGWRLAYEWRISKETLRPEVQIGWRHECMDDARTIQSQMASGAGTVFAVQSPSLGRDSLSLVTGLSTRVAQHLSIFAYYDGELASDHSASHTVSGGLSWDF